MLRVLFCPLGRQDSICEAFTSIKNVELKVYSFWERYEETKDIRKVRLEFLKILRDNNFDLIYMQTQATGVFDLSTMQQARTLQPLATFAQFTGDIRSEVPSEFGNAMSGFDYSFISSTGQLEMFRRHPKIGNCKVLYNQIGFSPQIVYPQYKKEFGYVCSFLANNYAMFPDSKLRYDLGVALHAKYKEKFRLCGSGWNLPSVSPVSMAESNDIYAASNCVLSISNFNFISHYFSDRLIFSMASGRPVLCYSFPGWQDYFCHMKDIIMVDSLQDITEKIAWCVDHPDQASEIGMNGYRKVMAEFTFKSRIIELLTVTNLLKKL